jgi:hypothetical protein
MLNPQPDVFLPNGYLDRHVLTAAAAGVLDEAMAAARATRWEMICSAHIFMGLIATPDRTVGQWARQAGVGLGQRLVRFRRLFRKPGIVEPFLRTHREFMTGDCIAALRNARERCEELNRTRITPADLLWAVLAQDGCVIARLSDDGLPAPMLRVLLAETERLHSAFGGPFRSA